MVLGIGRFWYADDNDACLYSAASAVDACVRVPRPAGSSFTYRNHPPHWQRQPAGLARDDLNILAVQHCRQTQDGAALSDGR